MQMRGLVEYEHAQGASPRWLPRDGFPGTRDHDRVAQVAHAMTGREPSPRTQQWQDRRHKELLAATGTRAASLHREGLHVGPPPHREALHAESALRDWQLRQHARHSTDHRVRASSARRASSPRPASRPSPAYDIHGFLKPNGSGRRHLDEPGPTRHPGGADACLLRRLHFENNVDIACFEPSLHSMARSAAMMMTYAPPSATWESRLGEARVSSSGLTLRQESAQARAAARVRARSRAVPAQASSGWASETAWSRAHNHAHNAARRPAASPAQDSLSPNPRRTLSFSRSRGARSPRPGTAQWEASGKAMRSRSHAASAVSL